MEDDIADCARSLLKASGCYSLPVDVFALAQLHGAQVLRTYRLSRAVPGFLYPGPHHPVIVLNALDPLTRQRFTTGHELWHLLYDDQPGVRLSIPHDAETGSWRERAAHHFAQELLMPRDLVRVVWEANPNFASLARLTGASKQALSRQLHDLGLA